MSSNDVMANVSGNMTPEQQQIIANSAVSATESGGHFSIVPDGSQGSDAVAQNILHMIQGMMPASNASVAPTQNGGGDPPVFSNMGGGIPGGSFTPQQNDYIAQHGASNIVGSTTSWLADNLGNWGLVVLGVVLGVGALLISQKQTIVNIGKTAAKVGAMVA